MSFFEHVLYKQYRDKIAPVDRFWGKYQSLNNFEVPPLNQMQNFWLERIRAFEKMSYHNQNSTAQAVNNFILKGGVKFSLDKRVDEAINKLYATIQEVKISGVTSKKNYTDENQLPEMKRQVDNLEFALKKLNNSIDGNGIIDGKYINILDQYIKKAPGVTVQDVLKNFYNLQGETLESFGTAFFNDKIPKNLGIEGVKAYNIAQLRVGKNKQQTATDMIVYNINNIQVMHTPITYTDSEGKPHSTTIEGLLNKLERDSKQTETIVLTDSDLEMLREKAVANFQAKSGKVQQPWNSKTVTINEFQNFYNIRSTFQRLADLKAEPAKNGWNPDTSMKKQDPAYQTMAKFGAATRADKILSLSHSENQFMVTPKGFVSYSERMEELFAKKTIQVSRVVMSTNVMSQPLKVTLG